MPCEGLKITQVPCLVLHSCPVHSQIPLDFGNCLMILCTEKEKYVNPCQYFVAYIAFRHFRDFLAHLLTKRRSLSILVLQNWLLLFDLFFFKPPTPHWWKVQLKHLCSSAFIFEHVNILKMVLRVTHEAEWQQPRGTLYNCFIYWRQNEQYVTDSFRENWVLRLQQNYPHKHPWNQKDRQFYKFKKQQSAQREQASLAVFFGDEVWSLLKNS